MTLTDCNNMLIKFFCFLIPRYCFISYFETKMGLAHGNPFISQHKMTVLASANVCGLSTCPDKIHISKLGNNWIGFVWIWF